MPYPPTLSVVEYAVQPGPGAASTRSGHVVVLVHGSLDRAESFRRVARRLGEFRVIAYDRRGYQRSRGSGSAPTLAGHIDDLLAIVASATEGGEPATAVGHSLGGDVVVGAALAEPGFFSSIGAYEPPMPWLGFRRPDPAAPGTAAPAPTDGPAPFLSLADDPALEAERFFRRMVSDTAWERLGEKGRAGRRADGPALVAELLSVRGAAPFDVTALQVPALFGRGGSSTAAHHRDTVGWLAAHVPGAELFEIAGATHGAHLSHPDAFAAMVRRAVALGQPGDRTPFTERPERDTGVRA
jgi:pimeloyl-ACP methyl ester carboxylesterase